MSNKRNMKWIMLTLACVLMITPGCSLIPKEDAALEPPLVKPVKETFDTFDVKKASIIKRVKGTATFEPTKSDYLQFNQSGGRISEVKVKSGDKVKKGDVMIQLQVDGLDIQLKMAQLNVDRIKLAVKQSKAQHDEDNTVIHLSELEIANMQLAVAEKNFKLTQLIAGMDGQVVFVEDLKPGDVVAAYTSLVGIADLSQMRLTYQVSNPGDISDVSLGMSADVVMKDVKLKGKVVQTPQTAPYTQNKELADSYSKRLYIQLDKTPDGVVFGDNADIEIVTMKKDNTIVIPRRGFRSYLGNNYVQIIDGDRRKEVDVEKGIETPTEIEILKGVKEGQKIILQ